MQTAAVDTQLLETKVKAMYRRVAQDPQGDFHFEMGRAMAERLGYPGRDLDHVPAESIASFAGVGYHFDLAGLTTGERVLDLGSGSGLDTFIASLAVGSEGRVVGIDMTDAQLEKSRQLADDGGFRNVTYDKSYIEQLPCDDASFDCIISNGVVNLSADKTATFAEAARVLRPGGRIALSDIVTREQLPEGIVCDATLWAACIGGAMQREAYQQAIEAAGLRITCMKVNDGYRFLSDNATGAEKKYGVQSISLVAIKSNA